MEKSEVIVDIAKALVSFQQEMETVVYDADNPFFKSKYATLAALVNSSKDLLAKNGLAVSQLVEDKGAVTTILLHTSGQYFMCKVCLEAVRGYRKHPQTGEHILEESANPQAVGSAISYARRYSYASILGLVSEKDDDGNAASGMTKTEIPLQQSMRERVVAEGVKKFKTPDDFKRWRAEHKLAEDLVKATESELTYIWAVLREVKK